MPKEQAQSTQELGTRRAASESLAASESCAHFCNVITLPSLPRCVSCRSYSYATVGGGNGNSVGTAKYATVSGGYKNTASGYDSFVGGGGAQTSDGKGGNVASGAWSAVVGGFANKASST